MVLPTNNQSFVSPKSGSGGGGASKWFGKLFGGAGNNKQAREMAQIQYDLHTAKGSFDTGEFKTRGIDKAAIDDFSEESSYKRNLSYQKRHDRWNAKFATDPKNENLAKNPLYVPTASLNAKGNTRQRRGEVKQGSSQSSGQPLYDDQSSPSTPKAPKNKSKKPRKPRAKKAAPNTGTGSTFENAVQTDWKNPTSVVSS